jgi:parallel beta-helix repeat protein
LLVAVAAALVLGWLLLLLGSPAAQAKAIEVQPGKDAIQKAVDRARPGDVLRIAEGRYREDVVVDKRAKLWGVDEKRPTIDGGCNTNLPVAVTKSGVALKHLKVVGAGEGLGSHPSQVDFRLLAGGTANDLLLRETCGPEAAAEYGINLLATRSVDVINTIAKGGFTDAGIYLGSIQGTGGGSTIVRGNQAFNNTVGLIVEESFGDIRVLDNQVFRNRAPGVQIPGGIFVNEVVGGLFVNNTVSDNGEFGVKLTTGSTGNVLNDNVITGNQFDLIDEGSGNCGSGNTIGAGPPVPPC